ncbi:unnamed protein product [Brugia pahangi]|uniref:Uncharacterized protein n=1 Tax=Brugia pahangi TaxID=6280 RepID=A0A0N4TEK8_BRUPA|nr:unnamed protein product [Brugia pahangi]
MKRWRGGEEKESISEEMAVQGGGASLCVPSGRSALLSAGKQPVGIVSECVVVLVNCPLDPDDPYLIALLCLHYLCNDHIC